MFQGVRYAPHSVRSETHRSPLGSAECKQSHDRQIIQEKEDQRLFKIEEDKGILQRHVSRKSPADEGIGSIDRNAESEDPQDVYYGKNVPLFRRNGYRKSGAMIP